MLIQGEKVVERTRPHEFITGKYTGIDDDITLTFLRDIGRRDEPLYEFCAGFKTEVIRVRCKLEEKVSSGSDSDEFPLHLLQHANLFSCQF